MIGLTPPAAAADLLLAVARLRLHQPEPEHGHAFAEVQLVAGGSAVHRVDGRCYPVAAGDVFVIRGASRHGFDEVHDLDLYTLAYDPRRPLLSFHEIERMEGFQCLFVLEPYFRAAHQFASRLRLGPAELQTARGLLDTLIDELAAGREGYRAMAQALTLQLATFLARAYTAQASGPSAKLVRLAAAVGELERRAAGEVRLAEIAAVACLSERHFRRLFSEIYGQTPVAYLLQLRLRQAARLLAESDRSVTQVALASGFADSNYLARQFRAAMGCAPSEYRARFAGGQARQEPSAPRRIV